MSASVGVERVRVEVAPLRRRNVGVEPVEEVGRHDRLVGPERRDVEVASSPAAGTGPACAQLRYAGASSAAAAGTSGTSANSSETTGSNDETSRALYGTANLRGFVSQSTAGRTSPWVCFACGLDERRGSSRDRRYHDAAPRWRRRAADEILQRAISEGLDLVVLAGSAADGERVSADVAERIAIVRARMRRAELILAEFSELTRRLQRSVRNAIRRSCPPRRLGRMSGRLVAVTPGWGLAGRWAGRLALAIAAVVCGLVADAPDRHPADTVSEAGPLDQPLLVADPAPTVTQSADAVEVASGDLVVRVRRNPWALEARVGADVVFRELRRARRHPLRQLATCAEAAGSTDRRHRRRADPERPATAADDQRARRPAGDGSRSRRPWRPSPASRSPCRPPPGAPVSWTVASGDSPTPRAAARPGRALRRRSPWPAAGRAMVGRPPRGRLRRRHPTLRCRGVLSSRGFGFLLDDTAPLGLGDALGRGPTPGRSAPRPGHGLLLIAGPPARRSIAIPP